MKAITNIILSILIFTSLEGIDTGYVYSFQSQNQEISTENKIEIVEVKGFQNGFISERFVRIVSVVLPKIIVKGHSETFILYKSFIIISMRFVSHCSYLL
jgi:hypothetical protein